MKGLRIHLLFDSGIREFYLQRQPIHIAAGIKKKL